MEVEYTADTPIQLKESKVSFYEDVLTRFTLLKLRSFLFKC